MRNPRARAVSPAFTTTYTLTASNSSGGVTAQVAVGVDIVPVDPQLTEFMADNSATLEDGTGRSSDWIELFNPNPFNLSIAGYFLPDDPNDPMKWRVPSGSIPANGHLVIFASGDDTAGPEEMHTNFQLGKAGEYLALVAGDGDTILDRFPVDYPAAPTFPPQSTDRSYGIDNHFQLMSGHLPLRLYKPGYGGAFVPDP